MKYLQPALVLTLLFFVGAGVVFPYGITVIAQGVFPHKANGSMLKSGDTVIGSELIGQSFARPEFFHPRPSAAGNGYDANNSGATNLSPTNPKLLEGDKDFDGIHQLADRYRKENGLPPTAIVPADAVTRSASGLDPHISVENALLQVHRIAAARNVSDDKVKGIIEACTDKPFVGVFGEPSVNVLKANLQLQAI